MKNTPLVLTILDGWGYRAETKANAIALARKPNYDALLRDFPSTLVHTSGRYVGLPTGQMGNSEVGHLNIGAGRVVYMDITKIDVMIENGEFFSNSILLSAIKNARSGGRRLHIFGLLSDGGVHSHQNHLYAILRMAKQNGVDRVFVHAFMDGRDTLPTSGAGYLEQLQQKMRELGCGHIASVSGRYYAMDRDKRWERERKAYDAMVNGKGEGGTYIDAIRGVKESYNREVTDEFIVPFVCVDNRGEPVSTIRDDDSCVNFNFRADRARQITRVLARNSGITKQNGNDLPDAEALEKVIPAHETPKNLTYICMTRYDKQFDLPFVVQPDSLTNILANVMGGEGLRNLRVAETEKYAHVTYFFNGGVEQPFPGEERVLVPSQKVATYDLKPEMSAPEVTDALVQRLADETYGFFVLNYANADMVGHTGNIPAAVRAVETVDTGLGRVLEAVRARRGFALVTADHGNAEQMIDYETGGPHTAHTLNPVPVLIAGERKVPVRSGILADVAPTLLELLGLVPPPEMTGESLILR